ncbi:MAG: MFS transporter [Nitrososphaera sp.]
MFKVTSPRSISRAIFALSLVSLVVMMGSSMATPSLALYAGEYSSSNEFMIGAVIAGFAIGRLIFDMPAGILADKAGISKTMAIGLGVLVASSLIAATAPSYWILLFSRIIEGIGSAIYVSAAIAFVLLASDASKRGTTMGTYQSILMTGPIVGPVAGAPIAAYFGLNAPYFAFAAMMAASFAIVCYLSHRGTFAIHGTGSGPTEGGEATAGRISLYLNTAGIATFGFAFLRSGIYSTGMPLFAYGSLSLSVFDVGAILTAASLANLCASYFSGRLTRMFGMRKPLFAAIMSSAVLVALIPFSTSSLHLLATMALIGVSSGFFGQSIAWAAEQIETKARMKEIETESGTRNSLGVRSHLTRGIGINRMIGDIGLILGPLFVGYIASLLSNDPLVWFVSFGMTSLVLGVSSLWILRSTGPKAMQDLNATRL